MKSKLLQLACEIELILLFSLLTRTNWSSVEAVSSGLAGSFYLERKVRCKNYFEFLLHVFG